MSGILPVLLPVASISTAITVINSEAPVEKQRYMEMFEKHYVKWWHLQSGNSMYVLISSLHGK